MIQDRDNRMQSTESDPVVSREYRTIATERTPAELDTKVLKMAEAAATKATGLRGFTAVWFRPLAFVATLALSLALVLELTNMPQLEPAVSPDFEFGRQEAESFQSDPNDPLPAVIRKVRPDADSPGGKNQSTAMPAPEKASMPESDSGGRRLLNLVAEPTDAPTVDDIASTDFAGMIEASSKQAKEADRVTENAIQVLQQTRTLPESLVEETAALRASAFASDVAPRPCDGEQTADPLKWWQCITGLKDAGRLDEANAELTLFNAAHPDFEAPVSLPSK